MLPFHMELLRLPTLVRAMLQAKPARVAIPRQRLGAILLLGMRMSIVASRWTRPDVRLVRIWVQTRVRALLPLVVALPHRLRLHRLMVVQTSLPRTMRPLETLRLVDIRMHHTRVWHRTSIAPCRS